MSLTPLYRRIDRALIDTLLPTDPEPRLEALVDLVLATITPAETRDLVRSAIEVAAAAAVAGCPDDESIPAFIIAQARALAEADGPGRDDTGPKTEPPRSAEYVARLNGRPQWVYEFGEAFDVPPIITDDPALEDVSWHNDVCPSFRVAVVDEPPFDDDADQARLWVDHPDPHEREYDGTARFLVTIAGDAEVYAGDDVVDAISALKLAARKGGA